MHTLLLLFITFTLNSWDRKNFTHVQYTPGCTKMVLIHNYPEMVHKQLVGHN